MSVNTLPDMLACFLKTCTHKQTLDLMNLIILSFVGIAVRTHEDVLSMASSVTKNAVLLSSSYASFSYS